MDVLVTYGWFPPTIYPEANAMPDDSIAEIFIESEDGDAIMNHADYMFYVSSTNNAVGGLENMMDIPGITMWDDNTPLTVTDDGRRFVPSLSDFMSDRPFHVDQLADEWFVEMSFAENPSGTRADPIVVRDGDRGRIIPVIQTNGGDEPKGAIAAEIIAWLFEKDLSGATTLALPPPVDGPTYAGDAVRLSVELRDDLGGRRPAVAAVTVNLTTDSATGAFDTAPDGAFDGTVTTVTIAAGEATADFYYRDTTAGSPKVTAMAEGLEGAEREVDIVDLEAPNAPAGEVAIYTGNSGWITKALADEQAQITVDRLNDQGVSVDWYQSDLDQEALAEWVQDHTGDGQLDVLITYGWFPPTLYPEGNAMPDGSLAELFIESKDGDAIINHADYMFFVSATNNAAGGLQNMMDVAGITMWDDNTPMTVTPEGKEISPTLAHLLGDYLTDRPLHLDELTGNWYVEAALAQNAGGTRADPVIVRDGNRGRLIPTIQTANGNEPKGGIAADIVLWLFDIEVSPTVAGISGQSAMIEGTVARMQVNLQDSGGVPRPATSDLTIDLATDAATGAFDTARDGSFDGSVTSVVIPAGSVSATVYYKDTAEGMPTLVASGNGLDAGEHQLTVFAFNAVEQGEVAIYTGNVNWIDAALAEIEAQVTADRLNDEGVPIEWFQSDADQDAVAEWVQDRTENGQLDVLVLYGWFPPSLYPEGNALPDDSVAELFIESEDGDVIINHADYMFYVSATNNTAGGLQNMMDIPAITMWDDNTPMTVTPDGAAISPTLAYRLGNYLTDRPLHLNELEGDWWVEASLAQNALGTRADPVIVRDGNRGRLIPVIQTANGNEPKGAIAADIIFWLQGIEVAPSHVTVSGSPFVIQGKVVRLSVELLDAWGGPRPGASDVTVNLASDSATGAFDTAEDGRFDGSVTSVVIPAGSVSTTVYYRDTSDGMATLTASADGLDPGEHDLTVFPFVPVSQGEVAIYTGNTSWLAKGLADEQAQITFDMLEAEGIPVAIYPTNNDMEDLAAWVDGATDNGQFDVLVLYGWLPPPLYPAGNAMVDDSIIELFVESEDGDAVINHADYMFYVSSPNNAAGGLQNVMDIPAITMWDDNTPMTVTEKGAEIAPSLTDFLSDRPFHVDELEGDWAVEVSLAQNALGTRADPIIVRDGNRGRLIPVIQTANSNEPKGAVGAEIITWMMEEFTGGEPPAGTSRKTGDVNGDGGFNISDPVAHLNFLFASGELPPCYVVPDSEPVALTDAGLMILDFNGDGSSNIADAVGSLNFQFGGGAPPALGEGCATVPGNCATNCE